MNPESFKPHRSNEEAFAHRQIKITRRVPQVRRLNLGPGVAFSSHSSTPIERGAFRTFTIQNNTEGAPVRRLNLGLEVAFSPFPVDRHKPRRSSLVKPPTAPWPISR